MRSKIFIIVIFGLMLSLQGCETAKGLKKDAISAWDGVTGKSEESWVQKTDAWMREHLW